MRQEFYITGHRNPDLDSICSAMAYADLKSQLDKDNIYTPVRCGHLSKSCKNILNALNIAAPPYLPDVFPKVGDVILNTTEKVDIASPLTEVAKFYKDSNPSAVPIYKEGDYAGLLTVDDISSWFMNRLSAYENIDHIPFVGEVMREQAPPIFTDDLFEEAKSLLASSQKRGLAVFEKDEFKGFVTRRCFLKAPRYNVILVDHNEPKQSIKGIEGANIVEIIDHHRLDAIKTNLPIFIDAEPLGSTCTIVYELFIRNGLIPSGDTAKILLTGMMADTLILRSPTTTPTDVKAAGALADIIGVKVTEFGHEMFSHMESLSKADPEVAILSDFKRYSEQGTNLGIGQCEVTTLNDLTEYKDDFLKALNNIRTQNSLDWAVCMVTDVLKENSILFTTDYRAVRYLPYSQLEPSLLDMPGVMSRKKQLLPEMIFALGISRDLDGQRFVI